MSYLDPQRPPTRAGINAQVPQRAEVTSVNADGTVDVRLVKARAARRRVPVVAGLSPTLGDHVVLEHFDGDPQAPVVTGQL